MNYLCSKETKSLYAIEGESPGADRSERFVAALSTAADFDALDARSFIQLQNAIVDPRYAEADWRSVQNFVGQTRRDFSEHVHYVCPKPEDVRPLMQGWMDMLRRLYPSRLDPVCAAAAASFGFVFIHPFGDGNGRIHRFLIPSRILGALFLPYHADVEEVVLGGADGLACPRSSPRGEQPRNERVLEDVEVFPHRAERDLRVAGHLREVEHNHDK